MNDLEGTGENEGKTITDGLFAIASALRALGTADAATPMGAIEMLALAVQEGFFKLADADHKTVYVENQE